MYRSVEQEIEIAGKCIRARKHSTIEASYFSTEFIHIDIS